MVPDRLAGVAAQMVLEPRAPAHRDLVAGLEYARVALARAAAHETQMAPVAFRQDRDDGRGFAMPARRKHDAAIVPFHRIGYTSNSRPRAL